MKAQNQSPSISFSIIKTSEATTKEGLTYAGGDFRKPSKIIYSAVLVKHPKGLFLFDTGLGEQIDHQYQSDIPKWKRLFLHYGLTASARQQLDTHGYSQVPRIFLSHGHWDHASGLVDFPNAEVWITAQEKAFLDRTLSSRRLFGPAVLQSQLAHKSIRWHIYELGPKPFLGFEHSYDIFGDSSAVLVPLPGHTPGSVGLLLTLSPHERILFCGDTVWNTKALEQARTKPLLARLIADHHQATLRRTIQQLASLKAKYPKIAIIPAHDAATQDKFGYFPHFYGAKL